MTMTTGDNNMHRPGHTVFDWLHGLIHRALVWIFK